jgi:alkylation response protein AidB-like acyl-CoA dehydrogenase
MAIASATGGSFPLTDEQHSFADALDQLCRKHLTQEYVRRLDEEQRYPDEAMAALAESGWAALAVPEAYGGEGGSVRDLVVVHETLAFHSLAVAQAYFSLWVLGAETIARLGSEDQRRHWLPRLAKGAARVGFALTEPGSGSDAAALRTTAARAGDDFVLNGQKVFITGAAVADAIITVARTSADAERHSGLSLFLVDPRTPGVTVSKLSKLGLKPLDLCEVFFADAELPAGALLGTLDEGWSELRPGFARERVCLAAVCLGAMRHVLELSTAHAREREAFGQPIGRFQMVAEKLVDMRVELEAARLLVWRAAERIDEGGPAEVDAAIAKLYAARAYVSAAREGVQVFGGYGYTDEYPVARHYRDSKFLEIGGGTSEIQKLIVGRSMGLL